MIIHPDATGIINVKDPAEGFEKLNVIADEIDPFNNLLLEEGSLEALKNRFTIPDEAIIPDEAFIDPILFKDWGTFEREKIYNNINDKEDSGQRENTRPNKRTKINHNNGAEPPAASNTINSGGVLSKPKIKVGNFTIPPAPESINLKTLLAGELDVSKRCFNLDQALENSQLLFTNSKTRTGYPAPKKQQINFASLNLEPKRRNSVDGVLSKREVIYQITLYPPNQKPRKIFQEFKVYGSQTLASLRDAIYCIEDFLSYLDPIKQMEAEKKVWESSCKGAPACVVEVSQEKQLNTVARKTSPSFFFFEDTLYLDQRAEAIEDYSQVIKNWAKIPESSKDRIHAFNNLKTGRMDAVKFDDIPIRLNQPYLFCHQGYCNHILIISQIRQYHPRLDLPEKHFYPIETFCGKAQTKKCASCNVYRAKHIVVNDMHAGESPLLQCDDCYTTFHFDKEGKPVYTFCHYPYAYS